MGLLDELKDKIRGIRGEEVYDDYDDEMYAEDDGAQAPREQVSGVLGNTRRPEAESVNVFTRSGKPISSPVRPITPPSQSYPNGYAPAPSAGYAQGYTPAYAYPRADQTTQMNPVYDPAAGAAPSRSNLPTYESHTPAAPAAPAAAPHAAAGVSGQLPAYVLKPTSYDDVQMVVRRVRTNQPVILVLTQTNTDIAKRILDFSLGLSCGIAGRVDELADRVFAVLPCGVELNRSDIEKVTSRTQRTR
ncbi:hypothetical protein HMPREF9248_0978 [Fannyhessea vaginae PB189-T1-4]|uniref:Cell division protein SepF n=1 Tax=Fannyhessea vaginae PB189-T1-4 TaxID=866774 RepID=A0ABN0B0J9_9ACTN|nr:cell division protein SepF [Fannyhessea vaginae]EFL44355.1 hypothetical protein HMPREF9248_0978 [Fannyhessea vaginae PB189-T1-4]